MSEIKLWRWEEKPRTMLRYVKPGNIFCFRYNEQRYGFGRIIAKAIAGHIAEIFDYTSADPVIGEEEIVNSSRMLRPVVIDTYRVFDRKREGDWRIIGYQKDYRPSDVDGIYFTYGVGGNCKITDVYGNEFFIDESEAERYPLLAPLADRGIKNLIRSERKCTTDEEAENLSPDL